MVDFSVGIHRDDATAPGDAAPDAATACGPARCDGCCDLLGACQSGVTEAHCGTGGEGCQDCTITPGQACLNGQCQVPPCVDSDGDGRGVNCAAGEDACDDDPSNWTASGCASCTDSG
jgi:hypothetical protein